MSKRHEHDTTAPASKPSGNRRCGEPSRKLTPPQVARHYGVSPDKVLGWIRSGELRAIDVAARRGGLPRYRIDLADLLAFEAGRAAGAPAPSGRQRQKAAGLQVIEFF